jgi:hypothetical protein
MAWFRKNDTEDSARDMVGRNPTGRERRPSAGQRRKAARRLEQDLKGSKYER